MVISCGAAIVPKPFPVSPNPSFIHAATQNDNLASTAPPLLGDRTDMKSGDSILGHAIRHSAAGDGAFMARGAGH
jgi:hypothetical protein